MSDGLAAASEAQGASQPKKPLSPKSLHLLKEQRRQDCARRQLAPL
jgi:hypothetical protein